MNLRFVEAFHWASSLKSITRAAEKLHITQSAMSSRIASLEEELGVVLLDRREKQFRLTVAGQRFQLLAVKLLDVQRQIKQELGVTTAGPMALRIGAIESVVHSWLPGWLQEMRSQYPDFELELTVETSPVLMEQIRRGAQDLVFTATTGSDTAVRSRLMSPMEMVFVGHRSKHDQRTYSLQELASFDLITFQRGSQPHQVLLQLFQESGLPIPRVHAISSISAMVQLVEGGFGVATLPKAAATNLSRRLPIRILRCEATLLPLQIHASYREDPGSSLAQLVLDSAQAYVGRTRSTQRTNSKRRTVKESHEPS
ncbi:DNA-binding transcriptional LysR family regulator [Herbaspirillum sp. Sphag1AN]|uniref:LysR family transcriptional regulator n=1 Tax=unclassified Herbaspirillum TaxID=2624150 RepID=UPI00161C8DDF|nr:MULTISPECIES: LysR family transcriptional regulator [unclassified Herbaspirillum]MBB3213257.1 DNA-binding transcriptional LysR family regulator [Herbaspirillum sp. Sphag1AN]MBB3246454.1 DNA-binding transcriptional LysR family regulator [Herbaspirillum sp. Sphag64]